MIPSGLREWYTVFLGKRGLQKPDQRDLYAYKITKDEFDKLESELKLWFSTLQPHADLNQLSENSFFNKFFVLYASEWWKRKYEGGPWSWYPILHNLGLQVGQWHINKRNHSVEEGFKSWNLPLKNKTGKRFLGSVAIQGGLPMRLMTLNQGSVVQVLHRVFELTASERYDFDLVFSWISALGSYLPRTYQKPEIYELLTKIVMIFGELKQEVDSTEPKDLLSEWHKNPERWRSEFPISIQEVQTEKLIKNLISKIAQVRPKRVSEFIKSDRVLLHHDDGNFELITHIRLNEYPTADQIIETFAGLEKEKIPPAFTLEIQCGNNVREVLVRKNLGSDGFRLSSNIVQDFHQSDAEKEITCCIRDKKGGRWYGKYSLSEYLDNDNPWIFTLNDENSYTYVNQGSCNVASSSFIAVIPDLVDVEAPPTFAPCGSLGEKKYSVLKFDSTAWFINQSDESFRVKTNYAGHNKKIVVSGNQLTDLFIRPIKSYRGVPNIIEVKDHDKSFIHEHRYRVGGNVIHQSELVARGPGKAFIQSNAATTWRSTVLILPENSAEIASSGYDVNSGSWTLKGWGAEELHCLTPDIQVKKQTDDTWMFTYNGSGNIPEKIDAVVLWSGNPEKAQIQLPFPGVGVFAYDRKANRIQNDQHISASNLIGMRLNILPGHHQLVRVALRIIDRNETNRSMLERLDIGPSQSIKIIRMIDFQEDIDRLLSITDDLDALIQFNIVFGDNPVFRLYINRYSFTPNKLDDIWSVPNIIMEQLNPTVSDLKLQLYVQRIDQPGEDLHEVELCESGQLVLPNRGDETSPWLLYSGQESDFFIRPTLLNSNDVQYDQNQDHVHGSLGFAIRIMDPDKRKSAIKTSLQRLSTDPNDPDWHIVEGLAREFHHLPLSTIDVWKQAILIPDFMATLITKSKTFSDGFMDKFVIELPYMFELISIKSFEQALRPFVTMLSETGLENPEIYKLLSRKPNISEHIFQFIEYSYRIALHNILKSGDKDISMALTMRFEPIQFLYDKDLNRDIPSVYQQLRHRHAHDDNKWPAHREIFDCINKYNRLYPNIFRMEEKCRTVTINTPKLLAHWAFFGVDKDVVLDAEFIMLLNSVKDFDQQWFLNAFKFTLLQLYRIHANG